MSLQHRPLTGMVASPDTGATPPLLVPTAAPGIIHQIDASNPTTYLDQVTLFFVNSGAAAQDVEVVVMGVTMTIQVPVGGAPRTLFIDQPFFGVPGNAASSRITVQNVTAQPEDVHAFGYFTR